MNTLRSAHATKQRPVGTTPVSYDPQVSTHCTHPSSPLTDPDASGCCTIDAGGVPPPLPLPNPPDDEILLPVLTGTGLDRLDPAGLPVPRPLPGSPLILPTGVAEPEPVTGDVAVGECRIQGILRCIQPIHVCAYAARSRSSRRRSNCPRYLS